MSIQTVEEFQALLRAGGVYETPPDPRRTLRDRIFGRLDTWYYLRMTGIVFRAYCKAKARRYDNRAWARSSFATIRLVEACGGRVRIGGAERLGELAQPRDGHSSARHEPRSSQGKSAGITAMFRAGSITPTSTEMEGARE